VYPAFRKEVHFYDLHYARGLDWYRAHFPLSWRMSEGKIAGEATPNYLIHPDAPSRLRATTPHAQLVVMVRDPIERAHSSWRLMSTRGIETATFEEAIAREQRAPEPFNGESTRSTESLGAALQFLYLAKSRYAEQIERWLEFFSQDQLTVVASEDLFADPTRVLRDLSNFLGIAPWDPTSFPVLNRVAPDPIDPVFRKVLADYFRPHNRRLELLLGRTFDWD
jgi:hypothetical protein